MDFSWVIGIIVFLTFMSIFVLWLLNYIKSVLWQRVLVFFGGPVAWIAYFLLEAYRAYTAQKEEK